MNAPTMVKKRKRKKAEQTPSPFFVRENILQERVMRKEAIKVKGNRPIDLGINKFSTTKFEKDRSSDREKLSRTFDLNHPLELRSIS